MYNYVLNHDHKFWTILVIKDVQKSIYNIEIKIQSHKIKNILKSSTHVDFFIKYIGGYNMFEII
jgi:hypothetical protein